MPQPMYIYIIVLWEGEVLNCNSLPQGRSFRFVGLLTLGIHGMANKKHIDYIFKFAH